MKVEITYTETQTFQMTKVVEMTKSEYKEFLKMSNNQKDRKFDFCGECDEQFHIDTTIVSIDEKIID
jgi:type III secretory pathway component EscR